MLRLVLHKEAFPRRRSPGFLYRVAPIRLRHAEALQQRHRKRQPDHGRLHHVENQVTAIYVGVAISDLDNQAARAAGLRRFDHQWRGKPAGDDVRVDRIAEHREASLEIDIPERLPEFVLRALRNVVDQNIQLPLLRANPLH